MCSAISSPHCCDTAPIAQSTNADGLQPHRITTDTGSKHNGCVDVAFTEISCKIYEKIRHLVSVLTSWSRDGHGLDSTCQRLEYKFVDLWYGSRTHTVTHSYLYSYLRLVYARHLS